MVYTDEREGWKKGYSVSSTKELRLKDVGNQCICFSLSLEDC